MKNAGLRQFVTSSLKLLQFISLSKTRSDNLREILELISFIYFSPLCLLFIERLVLYVYSRMPPFWTIFPLIYLTYFCHSATRSWRFNGELLSLNLEINSYICNILDLYLGFTLCLYVIHLVIKKGDKLKKSYPLVYNFIIIGLFSCLVIIVIFFLYILHRFLNEIFSYVVKMMANYPRASGPSSTGGPGGFGQPSGGGGRPPEKPWWPTPINGHYSEDPDVDSDDTSKDKGKKKEKTPEKKRERNPKKQAEKDRLADYQVNWRLEPRTETLTRIQKDRRNEMSKRLRDHVKFISDIETRINSIDRGLAGYPVMQELDPDQINPIFRDQLQDLINRLYADQNFPLPERKRKERDKYDAKKRRG